MVWDLEGFLNLSTEHELSTRERKLWVEIDRILYQNYLTPRTVTDFWAGDRDAVIGHLKQMKEKVVRTIVVSEYVELDDVLDHAILHRLFGSKRAKQYARRKTVQEMLDRMYPQQKIDIIRTFRDVPPHVYSGISALNTLRNSLAHRFNLAAVPKSKRLYKGKYDVFTKRGLKKFSEDMWDIYEYFRPQVMRLALELVARQRSSKLRARRRRS